MTAHGRNEPGLVSVAEIARLAGVGHSAVGNWRKRHKDFPLPSVQAPSGALFDLRQVEDWLIENGKITTRVAASQRLWSLADAARGTWHPRELMSFLISVLVFLEACERAKSQSDAPTSRATEVRTLIERGPGEFVERLRQTFDELESSHPVLEGLLLPGLERIEERDDDLCFRFVAAIVDALDEVETLVSVFEDLRSRLSTIDRFGGEFTTPDDLAYLITRVVGYHDSQIFASDLGKGRVLDPAVGEGGLLLMTAVTDSAADTSQFVGIEKNPEVARLSRARFYLYGQAVEIKVGDALAMGPAQLPRADLVVVDPPYGMSDWGTADIYLDSGWEFGVVPANSADMAWVQLAVLGLNPAGRACVVLPVASLSRQGPDARIRQALLESGAVESVIVLPPRLRMNTSIPLVLWLLRSPAADAAPEVLMVDATALGETGRSQTSLHEETITRLTDLVRDWRTDHSISDLDSKIAVAIPIATILDHGADLNPKRYQPAPTIDIDRLVQSRLGIRAALPAAVALPPDPYVTPARPTQRAALTDLAQVIVTRRIGRISRDGKGKHVLGAVEIREAGNRYLEADRDSSDLVTVQRYDIVVALDGQGGSFLLVDEEWEGAVLGPDAAILRAKQPGTAEPGWLYAWTQSSDYRDQFARNATGLTNIRIPSRTIRGFTVPLAEPDHQTRTSHTMEQIEAELMKAHLLIRDLEELRQIEADLAIATGDDR